MENVSKNSLVKTLLLTVVCHLVPEQVFDGKMGVGL
jgi:hypothetical protein